MAVKLSPQPRQQYLAANGDPLSGGKLFTYGAGSTTKQATYTTSVGDVANTNPIILDASGRTPYGVWLTTGLNYKFVLSASTDTDPPTSPIFSEDVVSGVNDTALSATSQWLDSGLAPTFVSATQFTLTGDQTTNFHVGRKLKLVNTGGVLYGQITVSVYTTLTTVTLVMDSGVLDSGLSSVAYGVLTATNSSIPLAQVIHLATNKTTPVAADEFGIWDSISGVLNRLTLANLKALVSSSWNAATATLATLATLATNATNQSGGTVAATTGSFSGLISADSGQIKFPATQNASVNANTLDDYEEGSWTPSLGGTATYISNTGSYTKIGDRVFFAGFFNINTIGTGNNSGFSGLPFANGEASITSFSINYSQFLALSVVSISGGVNLGATTALLYNRTIASVSDSNTPVLGNGSIISFSGHYKI